jgi:glycosyltransferase involved in cell wall biosynthesis
MDYKIAVNGTFLMKPLTGVQRYAREMLRGLGLIGFKDIIVLAPPGCSIDEIYEYKIVTDAIHFPWHEQWWIWEQLRLPFLLRNYPEHILWSPSNIGPLCVSNQVITMHDALVFAGPEWFSLVGRTYYRMLLPRLAKRVKHVITDSAYSKEELIKYGVVRPDKISIVPLGVSSDFFYEKSAEERTYVLNLGSRDPRKNVRGLISAWNKIDPAIKKGFRLGIVGGNIRGVVSEGLHDVNLPDVDFFGYRTDSELNDLFHRSVFFVYPSLYEGFGLPPLEAMASGVPVITSNTTSLPEVCGNAALYVDPYDEKDITDKMSCLLNDPALRLYYQKKSLEHVKQFTWERSARRFLEIMENV